MAYQVKNINPLDLKKSTGIGVGIPFNGPAVFNVCYTTKEQLKSNLINFFLTNKGERFMNPLFGSDLRKKLFEMINERNTSEIKKYVEFSLSNYFPNILINKVDLNEDRDNNSIYISINYSVPNLNFQDEITFNFNE